MYQEIPVTERVERLRAKYLKSPCVTEDVWFQRDRRQKLNYCRAWKKYYPQKTCLGNYEDVGTMVYEDFEPVAENIRTVYSTRLRRSLADAYVLEQMDPVVDPDELIVGMPDFSPLTEEEQRELDYLEDAMEMSPNVVGRIDHMALDFGKLLKYGVNGLIQQIVEKKSALDLFDPDDLRKDEFYESCLIELRAVGVLTKKYVDYLYEKGYDDRARILEQVPMNPARTFREALQSIHFYTFAMWGLFAAGCPDRYLYPYYKADIEAGRLTREEAQELVDCFILLYTAYLTQSQAISVMVGGRYADGQPVENELTWHFINSIRHTRTAFPNMGLALTADTSDELVEYAAGMLAEGLSHPCFFNDEVITKGLLELGVAPENACEYIHSCCVEITPCGASGCWTTSPYHVLPRILLESLHAHKDDQSFEAVLQHYYDALDVRISEEVLEQNRWQMERARNGGETARASVLVNDCIETGRSVDEGGAKYNFIQPAFLGIGNAIDSLAAIKVLVYDNKEMTLPQLLDICEQNFEGHELLRQRIITKMPHYGNDDDLTNDIAKQLTDMIAQICDRQKTFRNSKVTPSLFSHLEHGPQGKKFGATPDGRLRGQPLADSCCPAQGRDTNGPTASLAAMTNWNHEPYLGGIAVNLKFQRNEDLPKFLPTIIREFHRRGGGELQINSVNADMLRAAMENPENYRDLVVRVAGFSSYYVTLIKSIQLEILERTEHECG